MDYKTSFANLSVMYATIFDLKIFENLSLLFNVQMKSAEILASEHFDRIERRVADSVQFRIQQEINLRDDEIARLRSDLRYLRGMANSVSDMTGQALVQRCGEMKTWLAQARSRLELQKTELAIEHAKKLREIEARHNRELMEAQRKLTERSKTEVISSVFVRDIPETCSLSADKEEQESISAANQERANQLRQEIEEMKNGLKSGSKILDDESDEEECDDCEEVLARVRQWHTRKMEKLHNEFRHETERARATEAAIARAKIDYVIKLKNKRERNEDASMTQRNSKRSLSYSAITSGMSGQVMAQLASLRAENTLLKAEAARLKRRVYGQDRTRRARPIV